MPNSPIEFLSKECNLTQLSRLFPQPFTYAYKLYFTELSVSTTGNRQDITVLRIISIIDLRYCMYDIPLRQWGLDCQDHLASYVCIQCKEIQL